MDFNNWNGRRFDEVVTEFADFLDSVKETYYKNKNVEVEMNKKQQDLLHDLELKDLKYHDVAKLGKEIRNLRINRREYKNESMLAEPVKEFYKSHEGEKLIYDLRALAENIRSQAHIIDNQYYNKRSSIDNIVEIKKDSKTSKDNNTEYLIQLNSILKKYCTNLESNYSDEDSEYPIINAKMQLDFPINIKRGQLVISDLASNIEKYYRPALKNVTCSSSSSDMCVKDPYGKNTLFGIIKIFTDEEELLELHVRIREGKGKNDTKKKSSKKRRK